MKKTDRKSRIQKMKKYAVLFVAIFFVCGLTKAKAQISDFEDLVLDPNSYWNGSDELGVFNSGDAFFSNNYYGAWWAGFSYSNRSNPNKNDTEAQYNAIAGGGVNGSNNYAVGYYSSFAQDPNKPTIVLQEEQTLVGAYFTNNNYAFYSMRDGDAFAKKFEEGDWFKLTITGKNANNESTGTVEVFLAESTDIVNTWIWSDLSTLGMVKSLEFRLSSSDVGAWGMNTPAYFCMDNLIPAPIRRSSAIAKGGNSASPTNEEDNNLFGCFITALRFVD